MGKGIGATLELPSGKTLSASPTYRYVLVIDAGDGSWIESRSKTTGPIAARLRRATMTLVNRAYVFDIETGRRDPAAAYL